ncbi:hypothetical protein [Shewanella glacialipiscicola]|uniref:hypothetical protein n=1 Tax=Shewanella glacialipiscicola TaxID=614069 RepID=UPI0021DA2FB6|nr:hypothetical protein [Shewanella glacialipiscicola]MCU7996166.1 hypothetical protein [Shewanella glacialipiscicola]MCU8027480.1 hypothetical protein [Shewanella glacialipiscicola]
MSMFSKLTITATLVILIILAAGIYRFNLTSDDLYGEIEEEQVMFDDNVANEAMAEQPIKPQAGDVESATFVESESVANASEVMSKLFNLQTVNSFNVILPESAKPVELTHFININQIDLAIGDYQNGEVKGRVLLDYLRITPLNFDPALEPDTQSSAPIQDDPTVQIMPFVAPFIVTTQGSGAFWYLGFFNLDYEYKSLKHLNSVMLGDRIEIESIEPIYPFEAPYKLLVTYRDRAPNQPMSASPEIVKTLAVNVSETGIY